MKGDISEESVSVELQNRLLMNNILEVIAQLILNAEMILPSLDIPVFQAY